MDEFSLAVGRTFPWHELYTPDLGASLDFYSKALDMGTQSMDMGSGPYSMLTVNGQAVCGVFPTTAPEMQGVPPHWSVYISVDDVDARMAKIQSLGGALVHGPMDIPTVGRMALMKDPHGATFWIFKSAEQGG